MCITFGFVPLLLLPVEHLKLTQNKKSVCERDTAVTRLYRQTASHWALQSWDCVQYTSLVCFFLSPLLCMMLTIIKQHSILYAILLLFSWSTSYPWTVAYGHCSLIIFYSLCPHWIWLVFFVIFLLAVVTWLCVLLLHPGDLGSLMNS